MSCGSGHVSATEFSCVTGAHTAGAVTAAVANPDGQGGSLNSAYTYQPAPTVISVVRIWGNEDGGHSITVNGTGFLAEA